MRLLLDTQGLVWLVAGDPRLPASLTMQWRAAEHTLFLSAVNVNAWELSIKFHIGKVPSTARLLTDFSTVAARFGADVLDISPAHAIRAGALQWAPRDPFDRMLLAQALEEGLRLVTLDSPIISYAQAPLLR